MSDEVKNDQQESKEEIEKTFTQTELDKIVTDRLKREHAKYADYEELKKKAAEFDTLQDNSKTDIEKLTEQITALQTQIAEKDAAAARNATIDKIAGEYKVPAEYKILLTAQDEEGLEAQAKLLAGKFATPSGHEGRKPANVKPEQNETAQYLAQLSKLA
jgi:hypothetical protein